MEIRKAKIQDVEKIYSLITYHAELERMLFRSKAYLYENLRSFTVVVDGGDVVGCCALQIIWSDLAEVKSLSVDESCQGRGVGRMLVNSSVEQAKELGVEKVFALTLQPTFFERLGFKVVEKDIFPMKVWSDCARCPKQDCCDEIAVILDTASI